MLRTTQNQTAKYHRIRLISQGGMGELWEGEIHYPLGQVRRCALKYIREESLCEPADYEAFAREAIAGLDISRAETCDNLVTFYDFGTDAEGRLFIAMELVVGVDLYSVRHAVRGKYDLIRHLTRELCTAIEHVHLRGWIHRDIAPGNILLSQAGEVKLTDLGLIRRGSRTIPGIGQGQARYSAPEVLQGEKPTNESDLYALGVVLYELVTGKPPHGDGSEAELLASMLESPAPRLPDTTPHDLFQIITGLLANVPELRPEIPDIRELIEDEDEIGVAEAEDVIDLVEYHLKHHEPSRFPSRQSNTPAPFFHMSHQWWCARQYDFRRQGLQGRPVTVEESQIGEHDPTRQRPEDGLTTSEELSQARRAVAERALIATPAIDSEKDDAPDAPDAPIHVTGGRGGSWKGNAWPIACVAMAFSLAIMTTVHMTTHRPTVIVQAPPQAHPEPPDLSRPVVTKPTSPNPATVPRAERTAPVQPTKPSANAATELPKQTVYAKIAESDPNPIETAARPDQTPQPPLSLGAVRTLKKRWNFEGSDKLLSRLCGADAIPIHRTVRNNLGIALSVERVLLTEEDTFIEVSVYNGDRLELDASNVFVNKADSNRNHVHMVNFRASPPECLPSGIILPGTSCNAMIWIPAGLQAASQSLTVTVGEPGSDRSVSLTALKVR